MSMTQNSKRALGTLAALTALMVSSAVFAADAVETPGMKVVKDALTGQLRAPTTDELQSTQLQQRGKSKSLAKPVGMLSGSETPMMSVKPNGTVMIELTEDTMVYSVVQKNADGSMNLQCVTGSDAADKLVNSKSATKPAQEHKHDK